MRPRLSGRRYDVRELREPAGQDLDAVHLIRDEIGARMRTLVALLDR